MRRLFVRGVAMFGLATLGACADRTDTTDPLAAAKLIAEQRLVNERTTAHVARGIAMAMNQADLRLGVLATMRNSPYVEHKLVFQEFITTDVGKAVLNAAAETLGEPIQQLQQEIAVLPKLDFYLPVASQRLAWRGSPDMAVAAMYKKTGETSVDLYRTDGTAVTWSRDGVGPDFTVIVLHPAERHFLRFVGNSKRLLLEECDPQAIEQCDPGGGGGGGGGGITHGVYIDHFNPQDDDGWGFGDDEVRFTFTFESDGETVVINRTVPPYVGHEEDILVSARACDAGNNPPHFAVHIEEDDGGFNFGDDEWGTYHYPDKQYNVYEDLQHNGWRYMWLRMTCL